MSSYIFLKKWLLFSLFSLFCHAAEEFHPEIAHERELPYPTYELPVRVNFVFDPLDLLVWSRFDIIAKYIYAYYREMGFNTDWAFRLYVDHLRIWGNFQEWDGLKNSLDDFLGAFHEILDSIKRNGFDPRVSKIRIDNRRIPCEGSHRIGACLLYNKKIISYYDPNGIPPRATMSSSMFFRKYTRYVEGGLVEKYLDDMALHYAKLKHNTYMVVVFPVAQGKHDELRQILRMYGNIVYEKYIVFNENGQHNFIKELYNDQISELEQEVYRRFKAYENDGTMRVWLAEFNTQKQKNNCQQTIKDLFENEHAVCITSNHDETIRLGRILFLSNSIAFLNRSLLNQHEQLDSSLTLFKKMLNNYNLDEEQFCIVGDAVDAAFGGHDFSQIQFISSKQVKVPSGLPDCLRHVAATVYPVDELLFNPENHFYYKNVKWALPDLSDA